MGWEAVKSQAREKTPLNSVPRPKFIFPFFYSSFIKSSPLSLSHWAQQDARTILVHINHTTPQRRRANEQGGPLLYYYLPNNSSTPKSLKETGVLQRRFWLFLEPAEIRIRTKASHGRHPTSKVSPNEGLPRLESSQSLNGEHSES